MAQSMCYKRGTKISGQHDLDVHSLPSHIRLNSQIQWEVRNVF